jgi:hypothetical protein
MRIRNSQKNHRLRILRAAEQAITELLPEFPDQDFGNSELNSTRDAGSIVFFLQALAESNVVSNQKKLESCISDYIAGYFSHAGLSPETLGAVIVSVSDFIARKDHHC